MHLCWIRELKQRAKYFPSCIHVLLLPRDNCLRGLYLAMNYCSGNPMPNCFLSILVMATSPSVLTLYSMAILSCRLRDKATPPFHPSPVLSWLQTKHSGSLARQWWGPPEVLVSALQKGIGDWEPLERREELMSTGQGIWPAWNVMLGDREGVKVIGSPKTATISFCLCLKCRLLSIVSLKCVPMQNPLEAAGGMDDSRGEWKKFGAFCRTLLYFAKSKQLVYSPTCLWNCFAHTQPQKLQLLSLAACLLLSLWGGAVPQRIGPMLQVARGKRKALLWGAGERIQSEVKWGLSLNQPSRETSSFGSEAERAVQAESVLLQHGS